MFDLLFDTLAYRPLLCNLWKWEEGLQRKKNQDDLEEIPKQKKRFEEPYKAQIKYLYEREKELKTELKDLETAKKKV